MGFWESKAFTEGELSAQAARPLAGQFRDIHKRTTPAVGDVIFYSPALDSNTGEVTPVMGGKQQPEASTAKAHKLKWIESALELVPTHLSPNSLYNVARLLGRWLVFCAPMDT